MGGRQLQPTGSGQGHVASCRGQGNKIWGSVK
jgi:hypothetical protein